MILNKGHWNWGDDFLAVYRFCHIEPLKESILSCRTCFRHSCFLHFAYCLVTRWAAHAFNCSATQNQPNLQPLPLGFGMVFQLEVDVARWCRSGICFLTTQKRECEICLTLKEYLEITSTCNIDTISCDTYEFCRLCFYVPPSFSIFIYSVCHYINDFIVFLQCG